MALTQEQINTIIEIAKKYGATKVLLFGSALNNPEEANDIDIGVLDVPPDKFFLFGSIIENTIWKSVYVVPLELDNPFTQYIKNKGSNIYESRKNCVVSILKSASMKTCSTV